MLTWYQEDGANAVFGEVYIQISVRDEDCVRQLGGIIFAEGYAIQMLSSVTDAVAMELQIPENSAVEKSAFMSMVFFGLLIGNLLGVGRAEHRNNAQEVLVPLWSWLDPLLSAERELEGFTISSPKKNLQEYIEYREKTENKKNLFLEPIADQNTSTEEIYQRLINILIKNGWKIKGDKNDSN